jgi:hypothetical protein
VNVQHGDSRAVACQGLGQGQPNPARPAGHGRSIARDIEQLRDFFHGRAPSKVDSGNACHPVASPSPSLAADAQIIDLSLSFVKY